MRVCAFIVWKQRRNLYVALYHSKPLDVALLSAFSQWTIIASSASSNVSVSERMRAWMAGGSSVAPAGGQVVAFRAASSAAYGADHRTRSPGVNAWNASHLAWFDAAHAALAAAFRTNHATSSSVRSCRAAALAALPALLMATHAACAAASPALFASVRASFDVRGSPSAIAASP